MAHHFIIYWLRQLREAITSLNFALLTCSKRYQQSSLSVTAKLDNKLALKIENLY